MANGSEVPFAPHETFAQGEPDDNQHVGVGPYAGGATRSRATAGLQMLRRKIALRAELEIESAKIAETLPSLTEAENAELIALLASENARMDQDIAACRAEAQRIAAEEAQARHIKPLKVPLSRTASRILQDEIERRLSRGHCPPVELLTEQAIRAVHGE
jgi:hypothetical protein